ncbi:MAG TPA: response regulator transcription factor, partial [Clostridia bacterium]|nr:response regulator transcription factor [Clostridia bacterium]
AGISAYITKEHGQEELIRAIRTALDHRIYLSPEVASVVVTDYMKTLAQKTAPAKPVVTDRERQLLRLVAEGKRNKEIAAEMEIGVKSVETFRSRLMKKLGCASAADLTRYAIREGIAAP